MKLTMIAACGVLAIAATTVALGKTPRAVFQQPSAAVKVDDKTLQSYVGRYEFKADVAFEISLEDGVLYVKAPGQQKAALVATSPLDFRVQETKGLNLTFSKDSKGEVSGLTLHQDGDHTAKKVSSTATTADVKFDPNNFDAYAGEYEVQPGFILTITNENGKLMGQPPGDEKLELKHESGLLFSSEAAGATLTFVTSDSGKVVGVTVSLGGQEYKAKKIK